MKIIKLVIILCILVLAIYPNEYLVHSGRTDSYGGHNKTLNGTYHCHSGKCLEDAWQDAYEYFFPRGQEDGRLRHNRSKEIEEFLYNNLDPDVAEYAVPHSLEAYRMGYENTYEPTFWERSRWFILISLIILIIFTKKMINLRYLGNKIIRRTKDLISKEITKSEIHGTELYLFTINNDSLRDEIGLLQECATTSLHYEKVFKELVTFRAFAVNIIVQSIKESKELNDALDIYWRKLKKYTNNKWKEGFIEIKRNVDEYSIALLELGDDYKKEIAIDFGEYCGQLDLSNCNFYSLVIQLHRSHLITIKNILNVT